MQHLKRKHLMQLQSGSTSRHGNTTNPMQPLKRNSTAHGEVINVEEPNKKRNCEKNDKEEEEVDDPNIIEVSNYTM